ncbi:MAG TPA: Ku protein [Candidatus Dormibacteraeota bacterium]|nr:Ku protein [Candidatus Dormibacteraeota bacterium]
MSTAVWTGSLSLGMVVVPVRLYPAIRKKVVRFHELDRSGRRVRHVRVSEREMEGDRPDGLPIILGPGSSPGLEPEDIPQLGMSEPRSPNFEAPKPEIEFEDVRKGYEVAPGQYVSMTREEVTALAPDRSRVIDVQQFVDVSAVDPIYFESRYYVVPDREWSSPFGLLRQAMETAGRMAIAWVTLRSRRYLSVVRPFGELMLLTTMVHADEIADADFWIPRGRTEPTDKELNMAQVLIDTLSGPFEPERYPDEHRQRVLDAIEAKTPAAPAATPPSPTRVLDLMAALEASVKAAKAARTQDDRQTKPRRRRSASS